MSKRVAFLVPALLPLLYFFPALHFDFVYDDVFFVVQNPALNSIVPIGRFFSDAGTAASASGIAADVYRPLNTLSFALNKRLTGLSPAGFRCVNVLLHTLNGLFLFAFLRRRTGDLAALAGTGIFLFHPVQLESVVWISQRSILLCGFFCLAALGAWERAEEKPRWRWVVAACFLAAVFSKETAALLPLFFLVRVRSLSDRRVPLLAGLAVLAVFFFALRARVLGHWGQQSDPTMSFLDGVSAMGYYTRSILWPFALNVSVRRPASHAPDALIGAAVLAAMAAGIFAFRSRRPVAALGLAAFLIFWFPHSGVTGLVTYAADRFLYLPLAGLAAALAGFADTPLRRTALGIGVLFLATAGLWRLPDWKNDETLWAASVRADPRNPFAWASYGGVLQKQARWDETEKAYKAALQNEPTVGLAAELFPPLIFLAERRGDTAEANRWRSELADVTK